MTVLLPPNSPVVAVIPCVGGVLLTIPLQAWPFGRRRI